MSWLNPYHVAAACVIMYASCLALNAIRDLIRLRLQCMTVQHHMNCFMQAFPSFPSSRIIQFCIRNAGLLQTVAQVMWMMPALSDVASMIHKLVHDVTDQQQQEAVMYDHTTQSKQFALCQMATNVQLHTS